MAAGGSAPRVYTEDNLQWFCQFLATLAPSERTTTKEIAEQFAAFNGGAIVWGEEQCRKALDKVGYTKKRFTEVAIQRYTRWNTIRTAEFLEWRAGIDPRHIAFYDESAWEMGKSGVPDAGWGPRFERLVEHLYKKLRGEHFNLPVLASASAIVHWDFRPKGFNATTCCEFFEEARPAVAQTELRYIQMDNAPVHDAAVVNKVRSLTNSAGENLEVVFQPTYSPHLNPVELIFGNLKQVMQHDCDALRIMPEVALHAGLASISPHTLKNFALHCGVY